MRSAVPLLLLSMFACGGRDPAPAPGPTSDPGQPSTPSSPSSPSTPAIPTATPDPTSTTPSTPSPATSVAIQRLDASAECDGLLPDRAPAPVTISRTPPAGAAAAADCGGGLPDGTGHVAVSARGAEGVSWQVFAPDGTPGATFTAWPLAAQPSGWQGLAVTPADGGSVVAQVAFGPDGASTGRTTVSVDPALVMTTGWSLAGDPLGGSFALLTQVDRLHNHWSVLRAQRLDAAGAPRWPEAVQLGARSDAVLFLGAGVSRRGEALALWQHSAYLDVSWRDAAAGAPLAGEEMGERYPDVLGTDALHPSLELVPLLDGGLALRVDGTFRRRYAHLATRSAPLPAWLAERAGWSFRFTRGNAGYALFPPPGQASADCAQTIELRAPSGRLCGQLVLRPEEASACTTGVVDQGWDGTVVQQVARDACRWRFWPGLLAK